MSPLWARRAHDPPKPGRPSQCWIHRLRTGSILHQLMRPRTGVHHRAGYGGHVVVGADCGRSVMTPGSDKPTEQAQAIMERVLGLVREGRLVLGLLNTRRRQVSLAAPRPSGFSISPS